MIKLAATFACVFLSAVSARASYLDITGSVTTIGGPNSAGVQVGDPFHFRIDYIVFRDWQSASSVPTSIFGSPIPISSGAYAGGFIDVLNWDFTTPWGKFDKVGLDELDMEVNDDRTVKHLSAGGCCDANDFFGVIGFTDGDPASGRWIIQTGFDNPQFSFLSGDITAVQNVAAPEPNQGFALAGATLLLMLFGARRWRIQRSDS
ncbi:MAG TPA: hypothetical protein VH477_17690 [Bryobacteraceae bacterium]